MKRKIRRLRKEVVIALYLLLAIILIVLFCLISDFNLRFCLAKSANENALKYQEQQVLVFYPDCENGAEIAKEVALKSEDDSIVDYSLTTCGAYTKVLYPDGSNYYLDQDAKLLKINSFNDTARWIIADELRYQMKSQEIDEAYSLQFLEDTYYENLDLTKIETKFANEDLIIHFEQYAFDCVIPFKYLQETLGIDLGLNNESYQRQHYVSTKRKCICFTFDDGPLITNSEEIVNELFKYDASATFFVLGSRLGEKQLAFCKEAINKGMEYGSHTQSHKNLKKLSVEEAIEEVMLPYNALLENCNYQIKLYRPPYGSRNKELENNIELTAILWNVDSLDWDLRRKYDEVTCVEKIVENVKKDSDENDVILFHDLYTTSIAAAKELLVYYLNEGYQVVSVSELMEKLAISDAKSFAGK